MTESELRPDYPAIVRLCHWINVAAVVALAGSGLQIFNAHPALYAADASDAARRVFSLTEVPSMLTLGGWLAGARRLHFAAAWVFVGNGLVYLAVMALRARRKAVWPGRADWRGIGPAIRAHLRFPPVLHGPNGGLNPLQKIAYAGVALVLAPFLVATGLAMSPTWDAAFPFWADLFGGRQFARTWHFVALLALTGFVATHVLLVLASGPSTWVKMVTGGRRDGR